MGHVARPLGAHLGHLIRARERYLLQGLGDIDRRSLPSGPDLGELIRIRERLLRRDPCRALGAPRRIIGFRSDTPTLPPPEALLRASSP